MPAFKDNSNNIPKQPELMSTFVLLKRSVLFGLRSGDVVTQMSPSQLLILLPGATYENCEAIIKRLKNNFLMLGGSKNINIINSISKITPD